MTYEVWLIGGRYDGAVLPCDERAFLDARVILIEPVEGKESATETLRGYEVHFYYPSDFEGCKDLRDLAVTDDESVYHRCKDGKWRPFHLKRALGV